MIALAGFLLAAAAPAPVAGTYQIQQHEMGGGLLLEANGRFRYALSYGAADETSEGDWTFDGKTIRLTSNPMPAEPAFELISDKPAPGCEFSVTVDWGKVEWSSPPDVLVTYDGDPKLHFLQAGESGELRPATCAVTSIAPLVPVYGTPAAPLKLSPGSGHALSLRFVPNDLGRVAFRGQPVQLSGPDLLMERYESEIRFVRVQP
jgi:hypothetical protein